ncbi:MAG TPA: hypothetical protein VK524_01985 [Polyangiaceae bacterium]|nr:hypothetical protein [Polyangiaceae bacterium]
MDDFNEQVARLQQALEHVERTLEGPALEASRSLMRAVLDVHRRALADWLALDARGVPPVASLPASVVWLLAIHDLNPEPFEARVRGALQDALSALPNAAAELSRIEGERVWVRLDEGPAQALGVLARAITASVLRVAPECVLEFEGLPEIAEQPHLLPVASLVRRREEVSP